jgi:YVTN family beta-propeller protein
MNSKLFVTLSILAILLAGSMSAEVFIADDSDGDGVPDSVDACPAEDASFFDRDGDGCLDDPRGARHTEYWGAADTVVTYVINETGAPGIGDGSDFTALQAGMDAWTAVPNTDLTVTYGGTTPLAVANAIDQINLITMVDNVYSFGSSVLAVGITTTFTVDSLHNGRLYRPGEIVDADMIFNPLKIFTTSGGVGSDVQSVATHEGGHLYGISHSVLKTATMHYVLPQLTGARTLELDDIIVYYKAYPTAASLASANRISGTVTMGGTPFDPLPGAAVYVIDSASGDTTATDYTLPDGSYTFVGMPDGAYFISIHPLDGSSVVNFMQPAYVNALVETTAVTLFVPEYWDLAESAFDNPADKDLVSVAGGSQATADIISNIDLTPPTVVSISPPNLEDSVRVDASMLIQFSEGIDAGTVSNNFRLRTMTGPDAGNLVGGGAVILNDDSVLAFTPSTPYSFDVTYELTLNTDSTAIADKFGNPMTSLYVSSFITEPEPPLSLSSLAPNKGVVGSTIVLNGRGFSMISGLDTLVVSFNGVSAPISAVSPNRLVVSVPNGTTTGPVTVTLGVEVSNSLTFTLLSDVEIARGFEVGVANLNSTPNSVSVTPDGGYAYAATEAGASAVIVDPGLPNYLNDTPIPITGGLDDLDVTPDGRRVYGVSRLTREIHVIDSDPNDGPLFNQLLATIPARAEALGIVVEPSGRRAFVATPDSVIQVWDINLESATYQRQVGEIEIADANLRGKMTVTPAGDKLLAVSALGNLYVCDLGPDTLLATVAVGPDPFDTAVDPAGQRAYVSDRTGVVSVVRLDNMTFVQDITTGGSGRGLTITPAGQWLYSANRQLNHIDVIDLAEERSTFRSVAATIEQPFDPVDIEASPDGFYAYSVVQGTQQLVATAIGLGPYVTSISPRSGNPGHTLVINGGGYDGSAQVDFGGTMVEPDRITGSSIIVTVPSGATSGPVKVHVYDEVPPYESISNSVFYQVLGPTPLGGIRLAARVPLSTSGGFENVVAISPLGDLALFGGFNGEIYMLDIDPSSPAFNQFLGTVRPLDCCVNDIAISPDGKMAFAMGGEGSQVIVLNINQNSNSFGKLLGEVVSDSIPFEGPSLVKVSPSGEFGLVYDSSQQQLHLFDLVEGSPTYLEVTDIIPMSSVTDFEISPDGLYAVVMEDGVPGIWSFILDPFHTNYLTITSNLPFGGTPPPIPVAAAFYPNADTVMVWAVDTLVPDRILLRFDTSDFTNFLPATFEQGLPATSSFSSRFERMQLSPRGDRMIVNVRDDAFHYYDIGFDPVEGLDNWSGPINSGNLEGGFTPDASRYYAAGFASDSVHVFDFTGANTLAYVSGTYQIGVIGSTLPAPFRVRATDGSQPAAGVPVTFTVNSGNGVFPTDDFNLTTIVVATDNDGYAQVDYKLGPTPGNDIVHAIAEGLSGSPQVFITTAVADPSTLPLQYAQILPLDGSINVSVSTAILVTFSRGVDQTSITNSTLYLRESGGSTPIPVVYGFANSDQKVSLTPINTLDYNTSYVVEITAGILDKDSGALQNPITRSFTTGAAPPPTLASIAPPSGTALINVTLSGSGFDPTPASNTVLFNELTAVPTSGGVNNLVVQVPALATSGIVRVAAGTDTSNSQPFNVLVPSTSTVDDVIGTVATNGGGKTVTVSPNGSIAYTVVPESDNVIPIAVDSLATYPSVGVGDNPVSIAMHPFGTEAYVTNFGSSSLSIIGTDEGLPDFHTVKATLIVGANPIDVAVMPDGSRVFVANSSSNTLSIVDGDSASAGHNTVIGTVATSLGPTTVTVSPDGSRVYVGVETGIEILESLSYGVIGTVATAKGPTTVTVSPDGTLLFVVTTGGDVLIIDVEPGSTTQNSVIGTIKTSHGTTTVTVSPDGGLAYLTQNDSDEIIIINVETVGSVSVIADPVVLPPKNVKVTVIDTLETGNNPEAVAFDPTGSGVYLVVTSGDQQVTKYGEASKEFAAEIRVTPRTLNLQSRGRYVTGRVELAPPATVDANDIDVSTVMLNDAVPAVPGSEEIVDEDGDGIDELVVKFCRAAFQNVVPQGEYVPVWITGSAGIHTLIGQDTIRTIRPQVVHPKGGEFLSANSVVDVVWTSPSGVNIDYVDVHYSLDDGSSWAPIAERIPDAGVVAWVVPITSSDDCRVMVTIYRNDEPIGMGMSPETFTIGLPVSVTLTGFEAAIEEGSAVLRWTTGLEVGTDGYHLLRSESEIGIYQRVTDEMISAYGGVKGASYEYRDGTVQPNRRYFYKLEEVEINGPGTMHGPYELVYKLTFSLEQNTPNPFNPTTTIRYSVASDTHVRLLIYDVAGRRVRTLVDGNKRPNMYKVVWDGTNDAGQSVATGVYFYRITAGKFVQTKKMLLLK